LTNAPALTLRIQAGNRSDNHKAEALQDREHEKNIREGRIWAYLGDANNNLIAYDFTDSRKRAIPYSLNQWDALSTFTKDGELTIDNNKAERAMSTIAVGRKNWLFAGSRDGGKRPANSTASIHWPTSQMC
jgi:hypothetical protein